MVKNCITLHYIHFKSPLTQKVFNSYLNLVPADEQQRILRSLVYQRYYISVTTHGMRQEPVIVNIYCNVVKDNELPF